MHHIRLAIVAATILTLSACGGGSGTVTTPPGPPPPTFDASLFSGEYWRLEIAAFAMPFTGDVRWGTASANGVSNYTVTSANNDGGVVIDPATTFALGYSIDSDGTFHLSDGGEVARGGISADGSCVVSAAVDGIPFIEIMVRKPSTPKTEASMAGDYNICGFGTAGSAGSGWWMTQTLDGMGGHTGGGAVNADGGLDGGPIGGTYVVGADGATTLTLLGAIYRGGVSETTGIALVGGGLSNGDDPLGFLMVRRGAGKSNASLSGEYWLVGIESDFGAPEFQVFQGLATADGAGNLTLTATGFGESGPAAGFLASATYTVSSSGDVLMNRTGVTPAEDLVGGISPDNKWVVVSGGTNNTNNPVMMVLIKKQ